MAEDFDDITDEEPEGKAKGRKKPAKEKKGAEPAAPQPAEKGEKPDKKGKGRKNKADDKGKMPKGEKKKGGKLLLILIIALVLLVLIAAFCAMVYLNWWGMGDKVLNPISDWLVGVVVWLNPEFRSIDQEMRAANEERIKDIDEQHRELDRREEEVAAREEAAVALEVQIDRRSDALDRQEEQLKQQQQEQQLESLPPAFQRELTEQELADLQSLSRTYAQMVPASAAAIMLELYRPEDFATIIYFMSERNAAAILAELPPKIAALITEYLLDPVFAADRYEKIQKEYDEIRDTTLNTEEPEPAEEEEPED